MNTVKRITDNGNVMVKLLISIISVSVISTALLNFYQKTDQDVSEGDFSKLMSMRAKNAFDKIGYHFKLAGYGNTKDQNPLNIKCGDISDTLIIYHNDVEIKYFIEFDNEDGVLCEVMDGLPRKIIDGVESLRLIKSGDNRAIVEITLTYDQSKADSNIITKSYSTTLKLNSYL